MHRFFYGLSKFMALVGGTVLTLLILLTCVSILGRSMNGFLHSDFMEGIAPGLADWLLNLGIGAVNGDYEILEAGVAFAIFAFIPLCQITSGHAVVDVFTNWLPDRANRALQMVTEIVFAVVLVVIAVQLASGLESKFRTGQTTFQLQFPIWWAYAASLAGAIVAAVVGVYMACVRTYESFTGRTIVPVGHGADH